MADPFARQDFEKAQYASGASLGYVSTADAKIEQSPFVTLGNALQSSYDLCERIERLADRLVGPEPREASGQGVPPESPFILRAVEQSSYQAIDRMRSAMRALERIERTLP